MSTDRRHKDDSELKSCPVKTRFTDSEFEDFYRGAQMNTEGQVGPFVRECALLGLQMKQQAQEKLLAQLSGSKAGSNEGQMDQQLMIQAMQELLRAGIAANSKHQSKAA